MNTTDPATASPEQGVEIDVTLDDFRFYAYAAISEPDVNRAADIVPAERFEQDGDVHVAVVDAPGNALECLRDVAFNMNPGDCAVFLCGDTATYEAVMKELGERRTGP